MSTEHLATLPPGDITAARQQASRFWQARAPRERQLLAAMAIAVVALLVWMVAIQPALKTLRETPTELDRLDLQLQQMQIAALESETLRTASPVPTAQATDALRAATDRLGGKGKLQMQGDRATLTFTALPFDGVRAWLGEARSAARARPVEAQMLKSAGGYSGSISITLAGSS